MGLDAERNRINQDIWLLCGWESRSSVPFSNIVLDLMGKSLEHNCWLRCDQLPKHLVNSCNMRMFALFLSFIFLLFVFSLSWSHQQNNLKSGCKPTVLMIVQKMLGLLLINIEDVLYVFNHKLIRHFICLKAGNLGQLKFSPNITH